MPPTKKQPAPDAQPKVSQGRGFRGGNRQNTRGGRGRRPKQEPVHNTFNEPVDDWGPNPVSYDTWGQVDQSGWGVEQSSGWGEGDSEWATEAYTSSKIQTWARQIEPCDTHDLVRTPSATSNPRTTPSAHPLEDLGLDVAATPIHLANPQLYRWALDFLDRSAVTGDRKRQALEFLNQSLRQQYETIYALLQDLRGV